MVGSFLASMLLASSYNFVKQDVQNGLAGRTAYDQNAEEIDEIEMNDEKIISNVVSPEVIA